MNNRQLEIRKRLNLREYLKELELFAGRKVEEKELTSLQFMEEFREQVKAIPISPSVKFALAFEQLQSPEFASLVKQLYEKNMAPVYLWTSRTNDCGLFKVNDVTNINFKFPFDVNSDGILTIVTTDAQDRMLLDFNEEEKVGKTLEIEIRGQNWVKVSTVNITSPS
jgi:hypothetical protein